MLIPWSVGMKSKDVWLWDPARRWRKRKQNNRPTKGWTKITQTADLRITKTENTGRKDNRNEPSLHTSDVGAFVIHRSTHRGASYSWAIYSTYRRHWKWGRDGKRCTQWRRKTDVTSLGESNPKSLLSRNWAARSYYQRLNLWFQRMTGTMGSNVGSNTWMINKVLIQTSRICVERQGRKKKSATNAIHMSEETRSDYATISLRLKMFRYFQSALCSPIVLGTVRWWGILHIKKKKNKNFECI